MRRNPPPDVLSSGRRTEQVVKRLKKVGTSQAVALAVVVNSPGGLPVQSQIIG
jgi:ClpP class serine protease